MIGRIFLGRYETQKLLGEGGMGKVYLARQIDLNRMVVVKIMHDHVASDPKFRERFKRETDVMARFTHPNAVTLYDASVTDEFGSCIVMEYVKGINLESLLQKSGRLSFGRVARILSQLCDVLQAAHELSIIHRDLKPANIMICEPDTPKERVKVMDFGLAKLLDDGQLKQVTDTAVDFAVGTPGYIAPEQVRGEMMDHRGDLYSVGVMLFELITGRLPFQGATSMDVLLAHATENPPKFSELGMNRIAPKAVEDVIHWCLAKDPADRPQSARELADAYAKAVNGGPKTEGNALPSFNIQVPEPEEEPIALIATSSPVSVLRQTNIRQATPASAVRAAPNLIPLNQTPAPSAESTSTHFTPIPQENGLPFDLDVWMPQAIAVMKIRGFISDLKADILANMPGMIRIRLNKIGVRATKSGKFAWLGLGRKPDGPTEITVALRINDPNNEPNRLSIRANFRPNSPQLMNETAWRERCSEIFHKFRSYLMQ